MNRRVVILSFVYDSFANFSARWYMISSMGGVSFSQGNFSEEVFFGGGVFRNRKSPPMVYDFFNGGGFIFKKKVWKKGLILGIEAF